MGHGSSQTGSSGSVTASQVSRSLPWLVPGTERHPQTAPGKRRDLDSSCLSVQSTEAVPAEPSPWLFPNICLFIKNGLL